MPKLSDIVVEMKRSGIREIIEMSVGMPGVQHLEIGEPLFQTPPHIIEAGCDALHQGFTKYTPNAGFPFLREAISRRLNRDYDLSLSPGNIVVTPGGVGAVYTSIRALTDIGDEILTPDPGWPNYENIFACTGTVGRRYKLEAKSGFLPSLDQLEALITPKTKALLINTPSNPLGVVFPADLMRDLVDFARRKDLFLISDEVYEKIVFDGQHSSALSFDADGRVVGIFSFSKSYAMTGWRVGYAVAAEGVVAQMVKMQESYVSCTPAVSQKAAEAALNGPQDWVETMRQAYRENLDVARAVLDQYGIEYFDPQGAFYMWLNVRCADSHALAINLLKECQVAVAPGITFGPSGEGYVRISLASPKETIEEGLHRLGCYLTSEKSVSKDRHGDDSMISVTVRYGGGLAGIMKVQTANWKVPEGTTAQSVLELLRQQIGVDVLHPSVLIAVNGSQVNESERQIRVLKEGDVISLILGLAGG